MNRPSIEIEDNTAMLDLLPIGSMIVDVDLRICKWNATLAAWTGIKASEATGEKLTTLFPNLYQTLYEKRLREVFDTGLPAVFSASLHRHFLPIRPRFGVPLAMMVQQAEARLMGKDSAYALVTIQDVSLQHLHINQLKQERAELVATQERMETAFEWLEVSNTELRRTQREIRESQEYTDNIIGSMIDMLLVVNRDGLIRRVNRSVCSHLGYTEFELIHQNLALMFVPSEGQEQSGGFASTVDVQQVLITDLFAKGKLSVSDLRCRTREGKWLSVNYSGSVMKHVADNEPSAVILLQDITDTKRIQNELARAQRMESLGQLAGGVAHEINTPMQCLASNIEYLDDAVGSMVQVATQCREMLALPAEQRETEAKKLAMHLESESFTELCKDSPEAVRDAMDAVRRVIDIVRAMRAMTHPGTKNFVATDLNEMVRDAVTISANRWRHCGDLKADLCPDLPSVRTIPGDMIQVVMHLLVNAGDALAEQHEQTGIHGMIHVRTKVEDRQVVIEVEDNGRGISAPIRERIFEPFFTTKEVGRGTGQGLSVCYQAVMRHHGTIDFTSKVGEGTLFIIKLPIDPDAVKPRRIIASARRN
ncbi:PAS domain-containing sensor histidine kinase [Aeoliella mucimassa]|uniref:histidine kinase n=1 Tax=Aeoliella mucimassa TaxID=2527972 RepID=A0A518ALP9_9BACT|nr:ATP-binding protein [Aeoliella mucimassa]QDU55643.1 Sensor protein ZraS [Aeoliella mucimassa]